MAYVRVHSESYQQYLPGRDTQNSHQMNEFLYSSLDDDSQSIIALKEGDYLLHEAGAAHATRYLNGPLFLKVIIRVAHIDTRSTAAHIRYTLSVLPTKIAILDYDIAQYSPEEKYALTF
jgi:hypothetical protein